MPTARELLSGEIKLASLPAVYLKVRAEVENPNSTVVNLAKIISADAALTARVLRLVNSPLYGHVRKVETVTHALSILGTQRVHDLVLATSVASMFPRMDPRVADVQKFQARSVTGGVAAQALASICAVLDAERLFVEGLISNIGHLAIYQRVPEQAQAAHRLAREQGRPLAEVEREVIGCDYAEVSAELMQRWNLPANMVLAVRQHTVPDQAGANDFEPSILHLANLIADAIEIGKPVDQWKLPVQPSAWIATGLTEECYSDAKARIDEMFSSVMAIFFSPVQAAA